MKAASANDIKRELKERKPAELIEICLRLVRFKKENKELLSFLLFEAGDIDGYIAGAKAEIEDGFAGINTSNLFFVKKSLRKILRITNKRIRYTGNKVAEVELLLHYYQTLSQSGINFKKSNALVKQYQGGIKKIKTAIDTLHEDLQYEYLRQVAALSD